MSLCVGVLCFLWEQWSGNWDLFKKYRSAARVRSLEVESGHLFLEQNRPSWGESDNRVWTALAVEHTSEKRGGGREEGERVCVCVGVLSHLSN